MEFNHYSVLKSECIDGLNIKPNGIYIDATLGGAGHSYEIAKRLNKDGKLICFDLDLDAISYAKTKLFEFDNIEFIHDNFHNFAEHLKELNITNVDGILIDLGVSSYQLDCDERGFSYLKDAPLDMRMNVEQSLTAKVVVNEYSLKQLTKIFEYYGEEKFSYIIAKKIVEYREKKEIESTLELVKIIESAIPKKVVYSKGHSAKKIFQAIRIEVNGELENLENVLISMMQHLNIGGRFCAISFHSLEDKAVKNAMKAMMPNCICPKNAPICVCGAKPQIKLINKKPILPSPKELAENSRSKSAKLRICEKI